MSNAVKPFRRTEPQSGKKFTPFSHSGTFLELKAICRLRTDRRILFFTAIFLVALIQSAIKTCAPVTVLRIFLFLLSPFLPVSDI